ncbi:thiol-disulfide oxidoreductase ResA [Bacillaceae bacterium SIJ1]|uniref:thiol-disulfide oxidoreductase ResA n=1 Tax=Litoribacterium kuwaitense TaxID=1398745 RepID=UPI0013E9DC80|nr:thiol-disulfide oxidoreductase ResA [Litoribacterium kuwaitense]NGP43668.1 thiol-disulfide oxidoreductase ResA [Litoribacterium kuwaitense]
MNARKKKRLVLRSSILLVMLVAVGYTLYSGIFDKPSIVRAGQVAPNFSLETLDGGRIELEELRGKGVIINFWGTYCEPCEREMPALEAGYNMYKDQGVEVLAVNVAETKIIVKDFVDRMGTTFPILMDNRSEIMKLYGVGQLPSTFMIDPTGEIVQHKIGEMSAEEIRGYMEAVKPNET